MNTKKEMCAFCNKAVYFSERSAADDKVFHKACFKCGECKTILSLGKYASMEGKTFCKPCFKKMFLSKGNYSEGFGQLKPQHAHDLKKNGDSPVQTRHEESVPSPTPTPAPTATPTPTQEVVADA